MNEDKKMKDTLIKFALIVLLSLFYVNQFAEIWPAGYLGGYKYDHRMPLTLMSNEYQGYYPYWGYGLGLGKELMTLARSGKWTAISALLKQQISLYHSMPQPMTPEEKQRREIRLKRLTLHLEGLPSVA
jgi:hypothetical protein